jgi:hypothetical protein
MEGKMKKKIFLVLQFLLLSVILTAGNAETYNSFEKFNVRFSNANLPFQIVVNDSKGKEYYPAELNVGNYLFFSPTRLAGLNYYEFFSDVLKKDFKTYTTNKKGKIKKESKVYHYNKSDFYANYKDMIKSDRSEIKDFLGIVSADTKLISPNTYKITNYVTDRGFLITIPMNMAFYVKQVSDSKFIWSLNNNFDKIDYTFTLENKKLIVRNDKEQIVFTAYRNENSLFFETAKDKFEYKVNEEDSQFESYKNGKLFESLKYKTE